MSTLINVTTGDPTARFGFRGTDLGYFTKTNHGYCLATFGDTFNGSMPGQGGGWRSPVITRTHNRDLDNGLKWDNAVGGSTAKQVVDYTHQSKADAYTREAGGFTQIPNDVVHLPDGRYLLSTFVVRSWDRHGAASWLTWCNRLWTSTQRDAETWAPSVNRDTGRGSVDFPNEGEWAKFQNCSLVLWEDGYLYMFGTRSGRNKGTGVYLSRVRWQDWDRPSKYQLWGWNGDQWAWGHSTATPILMPTRTGGAIGEINVQVIEGVCVLAYVDYGLGAVTRTALRPDSVWTNPQVHATAAQVPNLYAPSVHPYSTLDRPYWHLSQWTSNFYGSKFYRLDPLVVPEGKTEPETEQPGEDQDLLPDPGESLEGTDQATCVDLSNLSAEQLAEVLTGSTSVSTEDLLKALQERM